MLVIMLPAQDARNLVGLPPNPTLQLRRDHHCVAALCPATCLYPLADGNGHIFPSARFRSASFMITHRHTMVEFMGKVSQKFMCVQIDARIALWMPQYLKCDGANAKADMPTKECRHGGGS